MNLMGPTQNKSLGKKKYIIVIVDYYSKSTRIILLRDKTKTLDLAKKLFRQLQTKNNSSIFRIRSDYDKEFGNTNFASFCNEQRI